MIGARTGQGDPLFRRLQVEFVITDSAIVEKTGINTIVTSSHLGR